MNPYSDLCFWLQDALINRGYKGEHLLRSCLGLKRDPTQWLPIIRNNKLPGYDLLSIVEVNQMTYTSNEFGWDIFKHE